MKDRLILHQTDIELAMAADNERAVLAALKEKHGEDSENYTGLNTDRQFYTGYRGEIAAHGWLRRAGVPAIYRVCTNGESQPSEIIIDHAGTRYRLEVKTAGKPWPQHQKLMMPAKQRMDFDLIVAARAESENKIEICGWLWRKEFQDIHKIEMIWVLSRTCDARHQGQGGPLRPPLQLIQLLSEQHDNEEPPKCTTEPQL